MRRGNIYFVSDGQAIKIGYAGDVEKRLSSLRTSTPRSLTVLLTVRGTKHEELALHSALRHLKIKGEWFRPADELHALISALSMNADLIFHDQYSVMAQLDDRGRDFRIWRHAKEVHAKFSKWIESANLDGAAKKASAMVQLHIANIAHLKKPPAKVILKIWNDYVSEFESICGRNEILHPT